MPKSLTDAFIFKIIRIIRLMKIYLNVNWSWFIWPRSCSRNQRRLVTSHFERTFQWTRYSVIPWTLRTPRAYSDFRIISPLQTKPAKNRIWDRIRHHILSLGLRFIHQTIFHWSFLNYVPFFLHHLIHSCQ